MKSASFEYQAPTSVAEAVRILAGEEDARVLAGGQSLVPLLAMRLAQPQMLVDLNGIEDLAYVRRDNGHLAVGAMTRQRTLEQDELVRQAVPALAEVVTYIGHATIRNRGTVGGSVAHADPAAELPAAMVGLEATFVVTGPAGTREIPADDFFQSYFTTTLQQGEILTEVRVPVTPPGTAHAFEELARRHGDFAIAAVMALLELDGKGRVATARLAVAGAGSTPVHPTGAESLLVGETPSRDIIDAAARAAADATDPADDINGSAEYRRQVTVALTRRALNRALNRSKGGA